MYGRNLELYEFEIDPTARPKKARIIKIRKEEADTDDPFAEQRIQWKREDNVRRASNVFRRIVAANLSENDLPLLITLTYRENMDDLTIGYHDFRAFVQALRYKYGKSFKYICVPEFQKRGAVHFHALFWRLPVEVFTDERRTRTIAAMWDKGWVDMKVTDGNEKISGYLAKYMAKAFTDPRLKNQKAYTASKNIDRPRVVSGNYFFWPLIDEYTLNSSPLIDKEFSTKWLGKCRYRHYRASN